MSATDELRKLLDERGADYRMRQSVTNGSMSYHDRYTVLIDGNPHALIDTGNDDDVVLTLRCTPEQAIASTLGTPISTDLRTALDFMRIWITEDAHLGESAISRELEKAEGLRKLDAIESAIAATLGRGTCEYCNGAMPIPYQYADGFSGWIEIVIDGASLFVQVGYDELAIPINYCPNCGAKVVK